MSIYLSPDCRDENHQKCNGIAWNIFEDQAVECGCEHPECVCTPEKAGQ